MEKTLLRKNAGQPGRSSSRSRGRPRTFDIQIALDKATRLFAEYGYDGTSLSQLTEELDIPPPSLYAAFGSKEELYKSCLVRYRSHFALPIAAALTSQGTAKAAIEAMLMQSVGTFHEPDNIKGCMITLAALGININHQPLRDHAINLRAQAVASVELRIQQGQRDGDVLPNADIAAMTAFYTTLLMGLSIKVHDGQSEEEMKGSVSASMRLWDSF
jgi:AcrR family transcriptional regulator